MSNDNSGSNGSRTNKVSIAQGTFNLRARLEDEREAHLRARRVSLWGGIDARQDAGIATSGSRGISPRTFRRWDATARRYRQWYFDAVREKWVEQDTRPRWQQDLDEVRARLAAKGKLPRSSARGRSARGESA